MGHSYVSCMMHIIFSTKGQKHSLPEYALPRVWEYIGGIARKDRMRALCVGGTTNHVHVLVSLPSTLHVAKCAQLIKGNSSSFVHVTFPEARDFAWQEGYGAFSIGASQKNSVVAYIKKQQEHHRKKSFEEEFIAFLERYEVDYDPKYVWD